MCINKKHKKQNLPIVTPKTEKDGWKVVLLYFFCFFLFLYCGKGEWLNQRVKGKERGRANRHWNHLWYAFCLACSASNQSIKINVCAQSDTRLENTAIPLPDPRQDIRGSQPIADIKVCLVNLCAPFTLFVYSVLYYRWLHFGSLFPFSLVCLGPNLSTGWKDCRLEGRIGKQIFMNNKSANGRQKSIRHNCKFSIVIDNVLRYRLLKHFPTLLTRKWNSFSLAM